MTRCLGGEILGRHLEAVTGLWLEHISVACYEDLSYLASQESKGKGPKDTSKVVYCPLFR